MGIPSAGTVLGPRLVVTGTHSGVGKTTVATGIMAALSARGIRTGAAKVGPDFIDPGYHHVAIGRPSRSLDAYLSGEGLLAPLAARASRDCEVLVVEGVMGMFDGTGEPGCDGSTAAVARALQAPAILVVDTAAMSGSVAAVVHGFATLDPGVRVAGVVLNRVGSEGHATLLREALRPLGVPVLGALLEDDRLAWRERHLGLVPVAERRSEVQASVAALAGVVADRLDLEALVAMARSAPEIRVEEPPRANHSGRARIAVCGGPAFSFVYPENLEAFEQAGAELAFFDPLEAPCLPDGCTGLYAGGGFPEIYASRLSQNHRLLDELRRRAPSDLVIWAECGGFMWLANSVDGHPMAGVLPDVQVQMGAGLTVGYRRATTLAPSFLGPVGTSLVGHEFHRSTAAPAGECLDVQGRFGSGRAGFLTPRLFASYLHQHLAATPVLAERFVATASKVTRSATAG